MRMSLSFIKKGGKCLFYNDHYGLLTQENTADEPSTATYRKSWKENNSLITRIGKWGYSKFKFLKLNYQLLKQKTP
jgi:hypothetical protein